MPDAESCIARACAPCPINLFPPAVRNDREGIILEIVGRMDELTGRLFQFSEDTPVFVAAYNGFDRLRYANRAFRSAFFLEADETPLFSELMRRNFHAGRGTVIRNPDFEAWLIATQSRRGKLTFRAFETDLCDGRWLWMTETVQPDGWMLCVASDITSLRARTRAVRQDRDLAIKASNTDELTGVANRRFVTARMEDMIRCPGGRDAVTGCLAILDLDHFKHINDNFGHQSGDVVLRDFAQRIQGQVRRAHCFGRIGGEEFVLVMPGISIDIARSIVERMLAVIRKARPIAEHGDFGYTFSAGIASARPDDAAIDLYARADKALYAAKLSGRNRIHLESAPSDHSAATG